MGDGFHGGVEGRHERRRLLRRAGHAAPWFGGGHGAQGGERGQLPGEVGRFQAKGVPRDQGCQDAEGVGAGLGGGLGGGGGLR